MMYGLVLVVHVLVAVFLIAVILLQGGRGGLGETLGGAAAQSLFGGGANAVMTKLTAVVAGLFMVTCLSLAMLSSSRGRTSIMDQLAPVSGKSRQMPAPHAVIPAAPQPPTASGGSSPAPAGATTSTTPATP